MIPSPWVVTSECIVVCAKCFMWPCLIFLTHGLGTIFIPILQGTALNLTRSRSYRVNWWSHDGKSGLLGFIGFRLPVLHSHLQVSIELNWFSCWGEYSQAFYCQLVLCYCLVIKLPVVTVTGSWVWCVGLSPHYSEGWAGRFFWAQESLWVWRFE